MVYCRCIVHGPKPGAISEVTLTDISITGAEVIIPSSPLSSPLLLVKVVLFSFSFSFLLLFTVANFQRVAPKPKTSDSFGSYARHF